MNKYDITGKTFGYLTVVQKDESSKGSRNSKWICKCKCGNITTACRCSLVSGHTASCGCKAFESHNATHGLSKTRIYKIWSKMKARCINTNNPSYSQYGGRGISVCSEWLEFLNFYDWSLNHGYDDALTIDRINVNGNYEPSNCHWIPINEQQANKTTTIYVEYNGQLRCLRTICTEIGFPYKTAHRRYQRFLKSGKQITQESLFAPIDESRISKRYRKS